jgi:hypothetical protein
MASTTEPPKPPTTSTRTGEGDAAVVARWRSPDESSCVSRALMTWLTPLIGQSYAKGTIEEKQLPRPQRSLECEPVDQLTRALWTAELEQYGKEARLHRVLWQTSKHHWQRGFALLAASGVLQALVRPIMLMHAVRALDPANASMAWAMGLAALLGSVMWLENWTKAHGVLHGGVTSTTRSQLAVMQLITLKSMRMRRGTASEGAEHELVGSDIIASGDPATMLPNIVLGVVALFWSAADDRIGRT